MSLIVAVLAVLALVNITAHLVGGVAALVLMPLAALFVLLLARSDRLDHLDQAALGITRRQLRGGVPWALRIIVAVLVVIAVGVLIPATRHFFLNERYDSVPTAVIAAFVVIPFCTVIPEEVMFRGVLQGALTRRWSPRVGIGVSAVLFGCWHIASSLALTEQNDGFRSVLGSGTLAQLAGILGAVIATGTAGVILAWLRYRTDSLLTPIALHWSLNAAGAVGAALAWHLPGR